MTGRIACLALAFAFALPTTDALQAQSPTSALADIALAEAARYRGDSSAWAQLAPGFVFAHSSGAVDDLASFLAFRARGSAGTARTAGRRLDAASPIARLDGDVLVRVRFLTDSARPGIRPGESRAFDVYVRRGGQWLWLAHQTSEVRARWAALATTTSDAGDYAGRYVASDGRARVFAMRGDTLVQLVEVTAAATAGTGVRRLIPLSQASFGYDGLNATITFVRDRTGRVVGADESSQVAFVQYTRSDK